MKQLIWTYRKWKESWETFYVENIDYEDYSFYCKSTYYENDFHFDWKYVLKESVKASMFDIIKYKLECLKYKN